MIDWTKMCADEDGTLTERYLLTEAEADEPEPETCEWHVHVQLCIVCGGCSACSGALGCDCGKGGAMTDKYVLDSLGNAVQEPDLYKWGQWMEHGNRRVENTIIKPGVRVSTVFLGLDHSWNGPPPLLWETMIFGGPNDGYQTRYSSRSDAIAGHELAIQIAKGERDAPACTD